MERQIEKLRNHFIVCGLDALGQVACQSLRNEKKSFVVIDVDQTKVDKAIQEGWIAIQGDVNEKETWERAGLLHASSVISAIINEAINVYIILMVRELNPDCFLISCGGQQNSEKRLMRVGADRVILPFQNAGQQMALTALRPGALQFFRLALDQKHAAMEMDEVPIRAGSVFDGVSLRDSDLRQGFNTIVISIITQGKEMLFNPQASYTLKSGDIIICLGHKDDMERLKHVSHQNAIDHLLDKHEIAEISIKPNSIFDGITLEKSHISERFHIQLLGIATSGKEVQYSLTPDFCLTSGQVLICLGHREHLSVLQSAIGHATQIPLVRLGLVIERIRIPDGSRLQDLLLRDSTIRTHFACNIVAVQRPGQSLRVNPKPDFALASGDFLLCVGKRENLNRLKAMIVK